MTYKCTFEGLARAKNGGVVAEYKSSEFVVRLTPAQLRMLQESPDEQEVVDEDSSFTPAFA